MASIRSRVFGAHVRPLQLDLADLSSLKTAVDRLGLDHLDVVVHNAGVALDEPPRRETEDGHELMFGTNHLGHFALTQWLVPLLSAASAGRSVTVGSFAARSERLDLDDLQSTRDPPAVRLPPVTTRTAPGPVVIYVRIGSGRGRGVRAVTSAGPRPCNPSQGRCSHEGPGVCRLCHRSEPRAR
uniref:Dehydrogenase n=1 Tax=Streptomyces avermitilis TaxID=33903 RepID=A0A499VME8_STRAX|nr:hypothetical protein SAVMC3_81930 [Streptomyces avermitilis]